ncbi:UDP-glucuronosyltransferase, putative [Ricinus communis]|uniref:UDP-glucuronosyltransferase, putative n=1 Tax=Ricinus communis TaxID=3988 RepID=B9RPA7_RICCO|nr:UDP-glucuronosyltransferase, putative [Ricinus communis]
MSPSSTLSLINHNRILDSRGPNSLDGLPDFHFATIPLRHPPSNSHTSVALSMLALREACRKDLLSVLRELVTKLNDTASSSSSLPMTCMLSGTIFNGTLTLSRELRIPNVLLWNMGASGSNQSTSFRQEFGQHDGMKGAQVRDLFKFNKTKDQVDSMEDFIEGDIGRASKA